MLVPHERFLSQISINCSNGYTEINVPDVELRHDGGFLEGRERMRKGGKEKEGRKKKSEYSSRGVIAG